MNRKIIRVENNREEMYNSCTQEHERAKVVVNSKNVYMRIKNIYILTRKKKARGKKNEENNGQNFANCVKNYYNSDVVFIFFPSPLLSISACLRAAVTVYFNASLFSQPLHACAPCSQLGNFANL